MREVLRMLGRAIPLVHNRGFACRDHAPFCGNQFAGDPGFVAADALVFIRARERVGPVAALKRSDALVEGNFELASLTAALAIVLEEAVIHAGAGLVVTGSDT
jgi:hypothetical protein